MKKNHWLSIIIFMIISTIAACTKTADNSGGGGGSLFGSYDQKAMLINIGTNVIVADINNFATASTAYNTAITSFVNSPDATSLVAAQNAYTQLALSWAAESPFDFGPTNDNQWTAQIDTWPANSAKIETAISAQADAATQGADAKGLKALEYLLFDANGNDAVLTKYQSSNASSANRKSYLVSVSQNISTLAGNLKNAWTGSGNYLNTFINAQGNDVSSSVSLLVNTLSLYLDEVKNMKIGNPIGKGVKVNDGQPHPYMIEYTLAEESLPTMLANVQSMKAAFDGGSGKGLDDLLNYVKAQSGGQNLSTVVDNQFNDVIAKINAITPPYATAIATQMQQLDAIFASLKQLIAYCKVDVANNLGVTITFSDTDGD